jgi:hypothetical protein
MQILVIHRQVKNVIRERTSAFALPERTHLDVQAPKKSGLLTRGVQSLQQR